MNKLQQVLQNAYQNLRECAILGKDSEVATQVKDSLREAFNLADSIEKERFQSQVDSEKLIQELRSQIDALSSALARETKECPCVPSSPPL